MQTKTETETEIRTEPLDISLRQFLDRFNKLGKKGGYLSREPEEAQGFLTAGISGTDCRITKDLGTDLDQPLCYIQLTGRIEDEEAVFIKVVAQAIEVFIPGIAREQKAELLNELGVVRPNRHNRPIKIVEVRKAHSPSVLQAFLDLPESELALG